jgi:hypothetical protein
VTDDGTPQQRNALAMFLSQILTTIPAGEWEPSMRWQRRLQWSAELCLPIGTPPEQTTRPIPRYLDGEGDPPQISNGWNVSLVTIAL